MKKLFYLTITNKNKILQFKKNYIFELLNKKKKIMLTIFVNF
jgi:hypothetical protein